MLSVPCHPVGSRDARKGRLYTWRQASPPSGARHHPGAYQAGRYHPGRPGQDARKGRLPAVEVSGARHNPAYQAGRYHLAWRVRGESLASTTPRIAWRDL